MRLLAYQVAVMKRWREWGLLLLLWRRQAGKTTLFSWIALRWLLENPGCLVTFVSASINVGREVTARVASLFWSILDDFRTVAAGQGLMLETNADGLDQEKYLEMFEGGRLEVRLHHSQTVVSRLKVIAPNPATARGYTGCVLLDEIGWIGQFRELWDAVEYIASRDPTFRILMATTPPADDTHFSYELSVPPEGLDFHTRKSGNWYVSQAGVQVHRVDVWDAHAAGVKIFDTRTREEVTPDESRARALDKDSWDRNMALKFIAGGAAAVSLFSLHQAQQAGRDLGVAAEGDFPDGWQDRIGKGPVAVGVDLATTEKEKSNPSVIAIVEKSGYEYITRLVLRFKTASNEQASAMIRQACDLGRGRRPVRLCIDATSERFFADSVRKRLLGLVQTELVIASENHPFEEMNMKTFLGNIAVNLLEDGKLTLPEARWLREDMRLVYKERGLFVNHLDAAGNHGDAFDALKLAVHGIRQGGPIRAEAAPVGNLAAAAFAQATGYHPFRKHETRSMQLI